MVVTIPLLGHGAGSNGRYILHILHVLAVSAWLGSLFVIGFLQRKNVDDIAPLLRHFSWVALPCATVVIFTGVILTFLYVGTLTNLFATAYGRTLLLKLAAFAAILLCGWMNWRQARSDRSIPQGTLVAEIALAAAVVLITSVLTEMDHP
jgi:putative copper export protein